MAPPPRRNDHRRLLRVLHSSIVTPSPLLDDRDHSVQLTYLDAMWLATPPVERVFLYRLSEFAPDDILSALKDSLSHALRAFYPLAGRLRLVPGTTNRYELCYQPQGVTFTLAEYDIDVDDLATDDPREVAKISPLVPPLPEDGAVLALQATLLSARRGLALGVTVHHAACDGAASTHFLHTWAAACAGAEAPPPPPVIDRTLICDRKDLHDMVTTKPPSSSDHSTDGAINTKEFFKESPDAGQLVATFIVSKEHLQSVKDTVAREAERRGVPPPRCSSTVATFGFVWHCHCRAKAAEAGERTYFNFPIDHRPRLEPPVPEKYLGNCVGPCFASAPKKEVAEGIFAACAAVAAGIEEAARGGSGYWNGKLWIERVMEAYSVERPLSVAGSPRFRVYDVDFGFGRPAKVEIVSVAKTGAISVAESRGGAGGMEVGICLAADDMERFARCFADGIASLASHHSQGP